jgi:hypothetical protein
MPLGAGVARWWQDAMQDEGFQLSAIIHDSAVTLVIFGSRKVFPIPT